MATVEYDDISLNITSKLDAKGIDKAVDSLEKATDQVEEFAKAVDSVDGNKIPQYIQDIAKKATSRWKKASTPDWEMDWNRETTWKDSLTPVEDATKSMQNYMKATEESTADAYNELKAYLELYPKTKDSYLKDQMGFDTDTIAHVRQDMYMTAEDAKRAAEGMREFGNETKKTLTPMEKLANRFKSFLQYRAMRAVWSAFVNGAKEGVKNLEDWDRNIGMTGFTESLDKARASLTILKNSLAVIVAPGLELISSVLQRIATWAMAAANAISRFFAILGGKSSYRAVKWGASLADSQTKAGSAAKKTTEEFKKQLMGFDEINNITEQKGSSGGGGYGNSGYFNYDDMFEERSVGELSNVEKMFQAIIDKIKEVVRELTPLMNKLKSIGLEIAKPAWEGFKRVLESIAGLFISIVDVVGSLIGTLARLVIGVDNATQSIGGLKAIGLILQGTFYALAGVIDLITAGIRTISYVVEVVGYEFEYWGKIIGNVWDLLARKQSFEEFKNNIRSASEELETKGRKAVNDLKADLDRTFNHTYYLKTTWDDIRNIHINEIYAAIGSKGMRTVEKYAEGGIVPQGQLFIAREAGAELVGNVGGHTAVMNNQDIVGAVSQGVAQAVASVMGNGSNVTVTLEGDAKGIFKVVQKEGRAYSARTGQPALA